MPRAVLAHCWTGAPDHAWYPHFKESLQGEGVDVSVPSLPDSDNPYPPAWLNAFSDAVGNFDSRTLLAGHSLGCATVLRYLERMPLTRKPAGVLLVAGFLQSLGIAEIDAFHRGGFNWEYLRQRKDRIVVLLGTADPYLAERLPDEIRMFTETLGADVWLCAGGGHFSHNSGCRELPQAIAAARYLLEMKNGTH